MKKTLFLSLVLVFISCIKEVETPKAAVVSARIEASKIGVEILKKGGNAFDAMIATNFALAVCFRVGSLFVCGAPCERTRK